MEAEIPEKFLQTEVLVIGAGGAGLRAAIEAKNMGVEVLIVSKGSFPSACTTAVAMGGMLAAFDRREDSVQLHFDDTVRGGNCLNNPKLVGLLVNYATERVKDLEQYGTEFDKQNGGYKLFPYTGSSIPRAVVASERYRGGYIKGLVKEAKRLGIDILDHVMVTNLIKEKDAVVGAVGLELETDTVLIISAKALILATGGGGNLYSLTTNPPGITGDGYALAFKAGAQLQDMEFIQSRVCIIYPEAMRGMPPPADGLVTFGGRFYNGLCERYMKKYYPERSELVTRATMAICAQKEILAGRCSPHGGVFGDLSDVPEEELSKFAGFTKACAKDFNPTWQPYEWAPGAHHFMGGIVINEKCETTIPGLYAAGEVTAGIHGANRLAGNALTETQVFGAIAGDYAAKRALSILNMPISSNQIDIDLVRNHIEEIMRRDKGFSSLEVEDEVRGIMSKHVGVVRSEDGLQKAIQMLDGIKDNEVGKLRLTGEPSFKKLANVLEVENLLIVGRLVTLAAMARTETRGAHYREDYPELNENWAKNIVFQLEEGETIAKMKPVEQTFSGSGWASIYHSANSQ